MILDRHSLPGALMRLNSSGLCQYGAGFADYFVLLIAYEIRVHTWRQEWKILMPDGEYGIIPEEFFTLWCPVLPNQG